MKNYALAVLLIFGYCNLGSAQAPSWQWFKGMGAPTCVCPNLHGDRGTDVTVDSSGYAYVTGYFDDTMDIDPGPDSLIFANCIYCTGSYVLKMDSMGNLVWAKEFNILQSSGTVLSYSIALDSSNQNVYTAGYLAAKVDFGGGIITASGANDAFISKLDSAGNFVWAKSIGNPSSQLMQKIIRIDQSTGDVYLLGEFYGAIDFDPGPGNYTMTSASLDLYILKLNQNGNFIWAHSVTGGLMTTTSMTIDYSGNVYTTGNFQGTCDFDPGAGVNNLTSVSNSNDAFILKLDASGNFIWVKSFSSSNGEQGDYIIADPRGTPQIYTTGFFTGTVDFDPGPGVYNLTATGYENYILKLDTSGNLNWAKVIDASVTGIDVDDAGYLFFSGNYSNTDFDLDTGIYYLAGGGAYVLKLNNAGTFIFVSTFTGGSISRLAVSRTNNTYVTGYFSNRLIYGTDTIWNVNPSGGTYDIFVGRMNSGAIYTNMPYVTNVKEEKEVYPDPVSNSLTINTGHTHLFNLKLVNLMGEEIFRRENVRSENSSFVIDVQRLPAGIYFLMIQDATGLPESFHAKFVKQ
jgi:hypothetical protein